MTRFLAEPPDIGESRDGGSSRPDCEVRVQRLPGCFIVRPVGEFDVTSAHSFRAQLCDLVDLGHVVVDLSGMDILDSSAMDAITASHHRAGQRGTSLCLARAHGTVAEFLSMIGPGHGLLHHADLGDAVEHALSARDNGDTRPQRIKVT